MRNYEAPHHVKFSIVSLRPLYNLQIFSHHNTKGYISDMRKLMAVAKRVEAIQHYQGNLRNRVGLK
jgi:hypothetical protein